MDEYATMSFDEKRAALLQAAREQYTDRPVSRRITYEDNEISGLLREYQEYKRESRNIIIQGS